MTTATVNPLVVTGATIHGGQTLNIGTTISDSQKPLFYELLAPTGLINLNGATNLMALPANSYGATTAIEVKASQLSLLTVTGSMFGGDQLVQVMASNDGKTWGTSVFDPITTATATITATPKSVVEHSSVSALSMFSVTDTGGYTPSLYKLTANTGTISLNGATNLLGASSTGAGIFEFSASDLANHVTYTALSTPGVYSLSLQAFDGAWSNTVNSSVTVTPPPPPPVPKLTANSAAAITVHGGQAFHVGTSVTYDSNATHFQVTDINQTSHPTSQGLQDYIPNSSVTYPSLDLAQFKALTYNNWSSAGTDTLIIRASSDNVNWSAPVEETVNTVAATITANNNQLTVGSKVLLSSLFTVHDSVPVQKIHFTLPTVGSIAVNGVALDHINDPGDAYIALNGQMPTITYTASLSATSSNGGLNTTSINVDVYDGVQSNSYYIPISILGHIPTAHV